MEHDDTVSAGGAAPGAAWLASREPIAHVVPAPGAAWLASAASLSTTASAPLEQPSAWVEAIGLRTTIVVAFLLIASGTTNLLSEVARLANAADPLAQTELADLGLPLMQASDCFTCHKLEGRLVGPSHVEIADFYADRVGADLLQELTLKVRLGGVGVWGAVPMLPHKSIPVEDAELMVAWILTRAHSEAAKAPVSESAPAAVPEAEPADSNATEIPNPEPEDPR